MLPWKNPAAFLLKLVLFHKGQITRGSLSEKDLIKEAVRKTKRHDRCWKRFREKGNFVHYSVTFLKSFKSGPGVTTNTCNPSYVEIINGKIRIHGQSR
jgi:hypothetical protein